MAKLLCVFTFLMVTVILTINKTNAQPVMLKKGNEDRYQITHLPVNMIRNELKEQNPKNGYLTIQETETIQISSQKKNVHDSSFADSRDGRIYRTVQIGNQLWMAENLNYNIIDIRHPRKRISFCNESKKENCDIYGRLYNWTTAIKVCPTGWHLPTDDEWTTLIAYLGGRNIAGGKMKETGTMHWCSPNIEATNESGFTALPGGAFVSLDSYESFFIKVGISGSWWSSTELSKFNVWSRHVSFNFSIINRIISNKNDCFSVRCLKDN